MHTPYDVYISLVRDKNTPRDIFRHASTTLSHLLAQQAIAHLKISPINIDTPLGTTTGCVYQHEPVLVPVLRSGLAMLPVFLTYLPTAPIGIIGIKRRHQKNKTSEYYHHLPSLHSQTPIIILEPILATGTTACTVIGHLLSAGAHPRSIIFVSILSSQEGESALKTAHPDVKLVVAQCDTALSPGNFIVPGLGDFGNRFFGTQD